MMSPVTLMVIINVPKNLLDENCCVMHPSAHATQKSPLDLHKN